MSDLQTLTDLVREAVRLEQEASNADAKRSEYAQELRGIVERDIPLLWMQLGLGADTVLDIDGRKIRAKPTFTHSIAGDRKGLATNWLRENGHAGMLRTTLTISFQIGQAKQAAELHARLARELGDTATLELTDEIHSSTLRSWLSEVLQQGHAVPEDVFGLRALVSADIGKPKT